MTDEEMMDHAAVRSRHRGIGYGTPTPARTQAASMLLLPPPPLCFGVSLSFRLRFFRRGAPPLASVAWLATLRLSSSSVPMKRAYRSIVSIAASSISENVCEFQQLDH